MIRDYKDGVSDSVQYFVGKEVEHTPMFGEQTLFVVGIQDSKHIAQIAKTNNCKHIYLGANMSFDVTDNTVEQWQPWEDMASKLLYLGFWVTLDIDASQVEGLLDTGLCENNQFIPMISTKIPYISQLGYNACLKVDDKDFNASNPGVWVHSIHKLQDRDCFTSWDKYKDDETI